jgi:hypothetical protein
MTKRSSRHDHYGEQITPAVLPTDFGLFARLCLIRPIVPVSLRR